MKTSLRGNWHRLARLRRAGGERGEFMEEGHEPAWGDELDGEQKDGGGEPCPEPCPGGVLEDEEEEGEEGEADEGGEGEAFEVVGGEGAWGGLIEAVFGFDAEGVVDFEGEREQGRGEVEEAEAEEALGDFRAGERADEGVEPAEAAGEPEGEEDEEADCAGDEAEAFAFAGVLLAAGVVLRAEDAGEFLREGRLEAFQIEEGSDDFEEVETGQRGEQENEPGIREVHGLGNQWRSVAGASSGFFRGAGGVASCHFWRTFGRSRGEVTEKS
jgi:hypothetical protein